MLDDKEKKEMLAELGNRLKEFEDFLERSLRELVEIAPIEDDPNLARLLAACIRTAGTAEAYEALEAHGPFGLIFFMMGEGERLIEGIRIQQEVAKRRQEILNTKCVNCEDKDECDNYQQGSNIPPVDENGCKILH